MGVAARGSYDLDQHSRHSGKAMDYLDEAGKRRYVPHTIEPSFGVDRYSINCNMLCVYVCGVCVSVS